jgi:flagellar biosynthesis/type III secretory pathway M-ring protein FliF/YscJ
MIVTFAVFNGLWLIIFTYTMRRWTKAENRANDLSKELNELTTKLYGSPENYERAKDNVRECRTDREQKVAYEAANKGITRSAKQYPSRFKGMR